MLHVFNFAHRPFRDERPVLSVLGAAFLVSLVLLLANWRLYSGYHRSVAGTAGQIEALQVRKNAAARAAEEARAALDTYRVSSLAQQSRGILQLVAAHRFSWIALLAELERVLPPDVRVVRLTPSFTEVARVNIVLDLIGRDEDSVVRTIAALSKDPVFSGVEISSEASQERGVPEGRSFVLTVQYAPSEVRR